MNGSEKYFINWFHLTDNIIDKYNITAFYCLETTTNRISTSDHKLINNIMHIYNNHFLFIVIGENCLIIPKLAALKWGYFEAIINRYNQNNTDFPLVTNITNMVIDTNIFCNISYTRFPSDFLRLLYETNYVKMYWRNHEIDGWKPLINLLIPPSDFWSQHSESGSPFFWAIPNINTNTQLSTQTGNDEPISNDTEDFIIPLEPLEPLDNV
tara:strand:- start:956 stop:1588 length:633 start_codon:yes stop_codon:yes gene_type:complete